VLAVRAHVFAAERLHGDDTTVPVLAKERAKIARLWGYVRDDRPFAGPDPPAVAFFYSPDRGGGHPERHLAGFAGILQADAYAGFNRLYDPKREPGPLLEAACWSHTIRTQCEFRERSIDAGRRAAQGNDMVDLQAVLMNDDALDHQLQDRPLLGDAGRVQPRTDAFAKGGEAHQRVLGPRPSFA
jgi:Transposase IS66 family